MSMAVAPIFDVLQHIAKRLEGSNLREIEKRLVLERDAAHDAERAQGATRGVKDLGILLAIAFHDVAGGSDEGEPLDEARKRAEPLPGSVGRRGDRAT